MAPGRAVVACLVAAGLLATGGTALWQARTLSAERALTVAALRALYARRSSAGRRDVRLLRRYAARGLRVSGLETQLLAVRVTDGSDRTGRLVLKVTDRVAGAVAVRGSTRVPLPAGAARG